MLFAVGALCLGLYLARDTFYVSTARDYVLFKVKNFLIDTFGLGKLETEENKYTLTYHNGTRRYKHTFTKKRGPSSITKVESEGKCVTAKFLEFLGPGNNFHGTNPTPSLLGFPQGITITSGDGTTRYFDPNTML